MPGGSGCTQAKWKVCWRGARLKSESTGSQTTASEGKMSAVAEIGRKEETSMAVHGW